MTQKSTTLQRKSAINRTMVISLVVVVGFMLRLWAAWQLPVDFDEPTYVEDGYKYAQLIQNGDIKGIIDSGATSEHPALVKLIYGVSILLLGKGLAWNQALFLARMVSAVFGSLGVLVLAMIDPLAGGLMAVQTLAVKYTSQAYLEAVPLFFGLLAILAMRRSAAGWNRWLVLSALSMGIMMAGKYSYVPLVFVILFMLVWVKRVQVRNILLFMGIAGISLIVFNPNLWNDPIQRIMGVISYHAQYSQGAEVASYSYAWYRPIVWVSRSFGFVWHPDVFFYMGFDGLIFLFALAGFWLERLRNRWILVWAATAMLLLLVWPTKWPQYTLVVIPAFCLAASSAIRYGYEKLREQELYWDWFHNMFPRPSRKYIIAGASLLGLLVVGALASQVLIAINRLGWSRLTADTSGLPNDAVNDILALPDGRILVGTDGGAAFWRSASGDEVMDEWVILDHKNSPLPDSRVLAVAQDRTGDYWLGTVAGLAEYDGMKWQVYRASDMGLQNEQINSIAIDGEDRVWVGTLGGAAMFDGRTWSAYTSLTSGLVDEAVFDITVQQYPEYELVWFGSLHGVSSLDPSSDQWNTYARGEIDLGWGGVSDLMIDSSGRLWVCTGGGGISLWDGVEWTSIRVSNSELPFSTIEAVAEMEPGVFWIAASNPSEAGGVLSRYDGEDWKTYRALFSGYSGAETVTMAMDSEGRLWFGTRSNGIDLFEPKR